MGPRRRRLLHDRMERQPPIAAAGARAADRFLSERRVPRMGTTCRRRRLGRRVGGECRRGRQEDGVRRIQAGRRHAPAPRRGDCVLPPEDRWRTTFSTYYTKLQSADAYRWRFVLDGTPEADSARRDPRITLIDLARPLERAPDGPYVEFARTGTMPLPTTTEPPTVELPAFVPLGPGNPPPIAGGRGTADPPPVGYGYGPATPTTSQEDGTEFAAPLPLENERPTRFHRRQPKRRWWLRLLVALLLVGAGIGLAWFFYMGNPVPREVGPSDVSADAKPTEAQSVNKCIEENKRRADTESDTNSPSGSITEKSSKKAQRIPIASKVRHPPISSNPYQ